MEVGLFPQAASDKTEEMASSSFRGGSGLTLGRISSLKGWVSIKTGHPGKWWSHCVWKCSINVWVWHLVLLWFWSKVGLNHLESLFQPKWFCDFTTVSFCFQFVLVKSHKCIFDNRVSVKGLVFCSSSLGNLQRTTFCIALETSNKSQYLLLSNPSRFLPSWQER